MILCIVNLSQYLLFYECNMLKICHLQKVIVVFHFISIYLKKKNFKVHIYIKKERYYASKAR